MLTCSPSVSERYIRKDVAEHYGEHNLRDLDGVLPYANSVNHLRRRLLTACVASVFALSGPAGFAASIWTVTSCADDGIGTLREIIGNAMTLSGDTIDLSNLSCPNSTISLQTGAIVVSQASIAIQGANGSPMKIDASNLPNNYGDFRVFTHIGIGTLLLDNLDITGGHVLHVGYGSYGGCIDSAGTVILHQASVTGCSAMTLGALKGDGGGVRTAGALYVKYGSSISGNVASGYAAHGGGAMVGGALSVKDSTISGNTVAGTNAFGGGAVAGGNVTLRGSTISGNHSSGSYGGVDAFSYTPASLTTRVQQTTISGNTAVSQVGGMYTNSGTVLIYNSTVAFNTAASPSAGFQIGTFISSVSVNMQSSVFSNNTYGSAENDFAVTGTHTVTLNDAPANNLVRATFLATMPSDTIQGSCPLLGKLRDNGGGILTHQLLSHSPAIDLGNNASTKPGGGVYDFDQRGSPYERVDHGAADIGAYEVQQDDVIFNSDFEDCPELKSPT